MRFELEKHKSLNQKIWDGFSLKPEVLNKLGEISDVFMETLQVPNLELADIVFTGSLANYNYTDKSDIDLHLVVDFDTLGISPEDFIQKYFNAKKTEFNQKHDITIYDYPVELYVEDINSPAKASGRYSLVLEKWLKTPKGFTDDQEIELENNEVLQDLVTRINAVTTSKGHYDEAYALLGEIYNLRASGLEHEGEMSIENMIFKPLRNEDYIEKLKKYMDNEIDRELSL